MGKSLFGSVLVLALAAGGPALAQSVPSLPEPSGDPMRIDIAADPILRLRRQETSFEQFRAAVAASVERHPGAAEYEALEDEARAVVSQAREMRRPTVDVSLTSYRVIARDFSDDPENILERARPVQRTDATIGVQQPLFDFGAGAARVAAAGARLRASTAEFENAAGRIALGAVASWYDVFGYRSLVGLTEAFIASQRDLRSSVEERIRQGASAEGDLPRIDSYIAQAETRLARYRRLLANAAARFTELTGSPPPADLERAPTPALPPESRDHAAFAAMSSALARSAQAQADAARQEARALRADTMPNLAAGIDAGRYGVFENDRDYDIRGRLVIRQRLFGGVDARARQAEARSRSADARATRIREEAARDASIAWSDVRALEQQLEAIEASYIAARRSRDVIAERFRAARGTLFDVVAAEDAYFEAATSYVQVLTELDAARYILLQRTGRLLDALAILPDRLGEAQ